VNAAKYLTESGLADPNRIVVMGGSGNYSLTLYHVPILTSF